MSHFAPSPGGVTSPPADLAPDALDDLALLDDAARHASCDVCHPTPPAPLVPFVAWCGRRAVWSDRREGNRHVPPANACAECRSPFTPCATCGVRGWA